MIVKCKCGEEFRTTLSRIENGRGKYCSQKCKYEYRKRPKGLTYSIVVKNKGWIKSGQRLSPETEFKKGKQPHNFKTEGFGYNTLHDWVYRHKGKPTKCQHCGTNKGRIEWANKSHEYKRNLKDWIPLCKKCHVKYDRDFGDWGIATRKFNLTARK